MTTTNEAELSAACEALEAHYGADAICGQPTALEAVHQARRLLRVLTLGDRPARELALALHDAVRGVSHLTGQNPPWLRYCRAAEAALADFLRVEPTKQSAPKTSYGYDGTACTDCGQFTVRIIGTCRGCTSCGWSGGCG